MGRVFVVQKQLRMNDDERLVPKFDLSSAEIFGEVTYLLSARAAPFTPDPVIKELAHMLADYDGDNDYLLLVGNPCLIGWTVALAANASGGKVRLLQWSGRDGRYIPIFAQGLAPVVAPAI